MAVLVLIDGQNGQIKSSALEAAFYGSKVANTLGNDLLAVSFVELNTLAQEELASTGVKNLISVNAMNASVFQKAATISNIIEKYNVVALITSKSTDSDGVLGIISAKKQASAVTNVVSLPTIEGNNFTVKRSIYTGKAFAHTTLSTTLKLISIRKNAIVVEKTSGNLSIENEVLVEHSLEKNIKTLETEKATGTISLPEANLVVSAGRGLKGPENWGMVDDLANALGAATACSKPVSDLDWRPHHEHVGQTGVKVSPNLYIACGISGAIQHLAGVNSSKVIVVINKDPEAPFFKAADYGIVGDVFDILPRLTKKILSQK